MQEDPFDLPMLQQVFQELRRGRHISPSDGPIFLALKNSFGAFRQLFDRLGFRLEAHPRGFYYFHGTGNLSDRSERMALFMFILIEWLSDQGEPVEDALVSRDFMLKELPHLTTERYSEYLKELGIKDEEGLRDILRLMERYGFLERSGADTFRFKMPVFRFVDLCHAILEEHGRGDIKALGPADEGEDMEEIEGPDKRMEEDHGP